MRAEWIEHLGNGFKIHRTYSLLILTVHLDDSSLDKGKQESQSLVLPTRLLVAVVITEIVSGACMAYFVLAFIQPIHLLLERNFGLQYCVMLLTNNRKLVVA